MLGSVPYHRHDDDADKELGHAERFGGGLDRLHKELGLQRGQHGGHGQEGNGRWQAVARRLPRTGSAGKEFPVTEPGPWGNDWFDASDMQLPYLS